MGEFTLSTTNLINALMIAAGIGVCGLSIVQLRKSPIRQDVRKFFIAFLWTVLVYISMHLARELLEGHPGDVIRFAIGTVTFIEFSASGVMTLMLVTMILFTALGQDAILGHVRAAALLTGIHILALLISAFTGFFYSFDANNVYHREKWYILSNLMPLIMMIQGVFLLVRHRDRFEKPVRRAFWVYLIAPLAAIALQAFVPGIQFVIIATVAGAVYMFAVITSVLLNRFEKQRMDASRIETELSMATRIQADMLPNIFPAFPERSEFDIFASMSPAKEVGGDFYDFFLIDEDHLGLVIADVSGKGVPAALFMMASKILVQNYAIMKKNPKEALEAANYQICQSRHEEMFVTVWLGILELSTGLLTATNAGHEYPVLKQPGGKFELYKDKHGFVLGGMEGVRYKEYQMKLEKGSVLFVYTDGVAEATDSQNEMFGTDRLLDTLNSISGDDPHEALDSVQKAVNAFVKTAPQFDDLTMLCLKYNGPDPAA